MHADGSLPKEFTFVLDSATLPETAWSACGPATQTCCWCGKADACAPSVHACAHLGGRLSEGTLNDGSVVCPWHGSVFALDDGRVLNGPATHN
jgi:Rieske Fe-S protein